MKQRGLSADRVWNYCFWFCFAGFALVSLAIASRIEIDYWDSYNFLLQARRLTDPAYAFVANEAQRPRALVILLTCYNVVYSKIAGHYPSLQGYHVFMCLVAFAYIFLWRKFLTAFFGRAVGNSVGVLLMISQLVVHYSMMVMTDLLSGLLFGATLLIFHGFVEELEKKRFAWPRLIALGVVGAFAGLSKHHLLLLLPSLWCVVLALCFLFPKYRKMWGPQFGHAISAMGISLLVYFVSTDGLLRVFGDRRFGLPDLLISIYRQAKDTAVYVTTKWMFVVNFGLIYMWVLPVLALGLGAWLIKTGRVARFWKALRSAQQQALICLFAMTVTYAGICQLYPYREVRYLLPFLPVFLVFLAWPLTEGLGLFKEKGTRQAYAAVLTLSLLLPVWRSAQDVRVFYTDRSYSNEHTRLPEFYRHLSAPDARGKSCARAEVCWFALPTHNPVGLWKDPYYAAFDLGPQIIYEARMPVSIRPCNHLYPSHLKTMEQLTASWDENTCYGIREARLTPEKFDALIILKPISFSLSERARRNLASSEVYCEPSREAKFACFESRRFFGN